MTLHSLVLGLILGTTLVSCGSPCQQLKATRCAGSMVQVCGSDLKWQRVMDCAQVKAIRPNAPSVWTCGTTTTGCTCVPAEVK